MFIFTVYAICAGFENGYVVDYCSELVRFFGVSAVVAKMG